MGGGEGLEGAGGGGVQSVPQEITADEKVLHHLRRRSHILQSLQSENRVLPFSFSLRRSNGAADKVTPDSKNLVQRSEQGLH